MPGRRRRSVVLSVTLPALLLSTTARSAAGRAGTNGKSGPRFSTTRAAPLQLLSVRNKAPNPRNNAIGLTDAFLLSVSQVLPDRRQRFRKHRKPAGNHLDQVKRLPPIYQEPILEF